MRLLVAFGFWAIGTVAVAQDEIISQDNARIKCKIKATSAKLIYYSHPDNTSDSIATQAVRELRYADSRRVFIVPVAQRGQLNILTSVEFQNALTNFDYPVLLLGKTARYDMRFANPANVRLPISVTPDTKVKLAPLIDLMKIRPDFSFDITIHSDTVGRADANQQLTDRQALALRNYLLSVGLPMNSIMVSGRGESQPVNKQQPFNQRIEFRCTAVEGVSILYAEKYTPPRRPEPVAAVEVQALTVNAPAQPAVTSPKKVFSLLLYGEGLYALKELSPDWTDSDKGLGISQGLGGGLLFTYYIKPRIGITAQAGYASWTVRRRYLSANLEEAFANDQALNRLVIQLGARLYIKQALYIQPMAGVQQLTLTKSTVNPNGFNPTEANQIMPSAGGAIGGELAFGKLLIDLAAQYHFSMNKDFAGVKQPLQVVGVRLGVGYLSKK